jgi:D-sedoheptulose 7-phosphate isomerase
MQQCPIDPLLTDGKSYFAQLQKVTAALPVDQVDAIADHLFKAYVAGRTIFLMGNGGSASLASHFACDLGKGTVVTENQPKRFRVIALTDNIPVLTAYANDLSYEAVFAEQLKNFVQPNDLVVAISGSGNSKNVLQGLEVARAAGAVTIGIGGFSGGKMKSLCDLCLVVSSDNMQHIEDLHLCIAHAVFTIVRYRVAESLSLTRAAGI